MNVYPKTLHESAIESIIQATHAARNGKKEDLMSHLENAKTFAEMHSKKLKAQGRKEESQGYMTGFEGHLNRVHKMLAASMEKSEECKCEKNACSCGMMDKPGTLDKAADMKKGYMFTGQVKPGNMELKSPGEDPRYHYKQYHELSAEEQTRAQHTYGAKEMGRYTYPTHKQTGELVHGARAPIKSGSAPKMQPSAYGTKEVKPEHRAGSSVRIDAPGTPHHGKFGIVHAPSPYMEGKVPVQVGASAHEKVYVEPHQVKPSKPSSKVEKALYTVHAIKKAFLK